MYKSPLVCSRAHQKGALENTEKQENRRGGEIRRKISGSDK
jgi:hypothetical protein